MTMITLQISDSILAADGSTPMDGALLERATQAALDFARAPADADLSLVLTDDDQLRALNMQFLGIDAPTDVLSFPAGEVNPETELPYLGDVIISYPRARLQAVEGGYPVEDELQLLAVHGVLHLLGRDHAEETEKVVMWAEQSAILAQLGCSITSPRE